MASRFARIAGACFLLLTLALLRAQISPAQDSMEFEAALRGLPSQMEGNIVRDNDGFLWFTYYGGVARYDGREVKFFEAGENALSGPAATAIVKDLDGDLWILTKDNGLNKYDKQTGKFTWYKHDPENPASIAGNISNNFCPQRLLLDKQGRIWSGSMAGISVFDKKTGLFTRYTHDPGNRNSLSNNNVTALMQDRDGLIWVATMGGGLNSFDETTGAWTRYTSVPGAHTGPSSESLWSLLEDQDGNIWVGSWDNGLSRFNKKTKTFRHFQYDPENPAGIADNKIYYLYEDASGDVWICHRHSDVAGLSRYDKSENAFIRYSADPDNPDSLSSNSISTVYEDPVTGIYWFVNTNAGVIDKYDKESRKFSIYQNIPNNPDSLSSSLVLVMQEDEADGLWISVMNALDHYDKQTKRFTRYPYEEHFPEMGNFTTAFCPEKGNKLWMLSARGVLTLFDAEARKPLKHYKHDPEDPQSIMLTVSSGGSIVQDRENPDISWLALSSGLDKFNKRTGKFTHFVHDPKDPTSVTQGTVWSAYDDGKGGIWASGFGGLCRLDKNTETFTRFEHDPKKPKGIGFTKQSCVFEDSFGNFWVAGFSNGMDLMDRETGEFTHFNKSTGFPANAINLTIQEDDQGHLWIGTVEDGLIKFDIHKRKAVAVYSKSDGLQDNTFWRSYKTREGRLCFGGGFGLNCFFPKDIKKNTIAPPVVLTSITQGGEPIELGTTPEKLREVTLGWRDNYFEFTFAALNYTKPEKNEYAYMLVGRDKDWYYSGRNPAGRYTGLAGGRYTLKIKGSNNDGVWNEEGVAIKIQVTPPFWRTTWFYLLLVLAFFVGVFFTIKYLNKLRHEIRERQAAEKALRDSEEKYRVLVEHSPDLRYRTNNQGEITFLSQSVLKLSGYTVEEALGMKMAEQVYADPEERQALFMTLREKGFVQDFEARLKRKDGSIWWASTNAHFFKDKDGNILGVEGVTRDITERKLAEQELSRLRTYLSSIIDSMPSMLVGVDKDCRVTLLNRTAEQNLGLSEEDARGRPLSDVSPRLTPLMGMIYESIEKGELKKQHKVRSEIAEGVVHEDVTAAPLPLAGMDGAVVLIEDVTQQVTLQAMMVQSEKMMSVGGLAAGMAHEINNPLAAVLGYVNIIDKRISKDLAKNVTVAQECGVELEKVQAYLEKRGIPKMIRGIHDSGYRAATIVRNMLSFSRKSEQQLVPVAVAELLDNTLDLAESDYNFEQQYDFKKIDIIREYSQSLPLLQCEVNEIQQVFLNLFKNSAEAMAEKEYSDDAPRLVVRTRREGDMAVIEVEDNGPGMGEEVRSRILEPFFTTKDVGRGTGLGLSVSYFIVTEQHGGAMEVDSKPGEWTRFVVKLPLRNGAGE